MAENNEPAAGPPGEPENPALAQRRIFGTRRLAVTPPPAEPERPGLEQKLASLVDSVKDLQSQIKTDPAAGEAEPKIRRLKRFQRTGADEAAGAESEPVLDHEVRGDEPTLNKNIAWPRLARPEDAPPSAIDKFGALLRRFPIVIWVVAQVTGIGLLLLGYWLGQTGGADDKPAGPEAGTVAKATVATELTRLGVNDRALEAANRGLDAEKSGDLKTARETYEAAAGGTVILPGSEYRLAILDIQRGDLSEADIRLQHSLKKGEMMGSCYLVNAAFATRGGDYGEVAKQLAAAVRVEPFNALYYFCWGEALRRSGKVQAGIDTMENALKRPVSSADEELMNFKLRLAKVENGHDEAFNAELAAHLQQPPVRGDWLMLAAAQHLLKASFPAAAQDLQAAAQALPPEKYGLWVQDYVFQEYAGHPEVAPFLKFVPPQVPMDPGVWTAAEADPAVWPPVAPVP